MFIEYPLLDRINYGFTGGPGYLVTKVRLNSGVVARNAEWEDPLYGWMAPYDSIDGEHFGDVLSAYNACNGSLYGFRFKDKADYRLEDEVIGTATGGEETMQIVRNYPFGPETKVRVIKKPVDGTIEASADGVPIASTTDPTTGLITFTASAGEVITVTGEFDVPVYFVDDQLQFTYNNWDAHSAQITLEEDRRA